MSFSRLVGLMMIIHRGRPAFTNSNNPDNIQDRFSSLFCEKVLPIHPAVLSLGIFY
jgi:hypothetical protein